MCLGFFPGRSDVRVKWIAAQLELAGLKDTPTLWTVAHTHALTLVVLITYGL